MNRMIALAIVVLLLIAAVPATFAQDTPPTPPVAIPYPNTSLGNFEIQDLMRDLEAEDRLGNFEIQDLMSRYNQSEALASSVQKKLDDTESAIIGKVG